MYISIITEPRAGSTNLKNWFSTNFDFFTAFDLPSNAQLDQYQNGINPKDYKYNTNNILIKEDHLLGYDFTDLINCSDKVIFFIS